MFAITTRILRDRFITFLSYTLGSVALVWLYVTMMPTVQESQVQVQEVLKTMPEGFLKAFGISGIDLNSLEALLATKQYNLVWPMLLIFLTVSIAGGLIAGEIENHTIELTLSSAKSRFEIFLGKYLAGFIYTILFVIATTLCAIPIANLYGYDHAVSNYYSLMYLALAFGWATYSLAILFSSIFSSKGKVYFSFGMIYLVMYVVFILTTLKDSLKDLQYLSFFYYFNINDSLIFNNVDSTSIIVFLGVGILSFIASLIAFNERDVA